MFLFYRFNYGLREVFTGSAEKLPVLKRDGSKVWVHFLGYISIDEAKAGQHSKPCKISDVEAYSTEGLFQRFYLPKKSIVQGCLLNGGVYCVLEQGVPVVISSSDEDAKTQNKNNVVKLRPNC